MTKKYWADWQNRIGETKNIYGWCSYKTYDGKVKKHVGGTLVSYLPFKILSAKFNGNTVDLKIEVTSEVAFSNSHHIENKYITLHRNDISTIVFNKY